MTTALPRDGTRLFQTRGRGEKAVLGELPPRVHGELRERAPHHIGRDRLGAAPRMTPAARAR